jgi:hypothetical protein
MISSQSKVPMYDWFGVSDKVRYVGDSHPFHDPITGHLFKKRADENAERDPIKEAEFKVSNRILFFKTELKKEKRSFVRGS